MNDHFKRVAQIVFLPFLLLLEYSRLQFLLCRRHGFCVAILCDTRRHEVHSRDLKLDRVVIYRGG